MENLTCKFVIKIRWISVLYQPLFNTKYNKSKMHNKGSTFKPRTRSKPRAHFDRRRAAYNHKHRINKKQTNKQTMTAGTKSNESSRAEGNPLRQLQKGGKSDAEQRLIFRDLY